MRMVGRLLVLALLVFPGSARAQAAKGEEFVFYGLRFGMSPDEVRAVFPNSADGVEVPKPGHGMMSLTLAYDFRNRLSEIRAAYERPPEPLKVEGLKLALRDRFTQPIQSRWRNVSATIDEYSNRAALTLVLISLDQREEAISYYRNAFLKQME